MEQAFQMGKYMDEAMNGDENRLHLKKYIKMDLNITKDTKSHNRISIILR